MSVVNESSVARAANDAGPTTGGLRANLGVIVSIPIMVVVMLGGWIAWRTTTSLDDIEARILDWGAVGTMLQEHLKLTGVTSIVVLVTAIPVGIALTRPALRKFTGPVVALANAGQAAPVIGVIVLLAIWIGFGFRTAVISLAIYAFLPVLRNTIVGLQSIDPTLIEAGQGMGMSKLAVLLRIEVPMAVPIIMTGVRTTLVLVAGTAAFGVFINAGGLGALIKTGIELQRDSVLVSGAVLIAALALLIDWLGRLLELAATPKGMR